MLFTFIQERATHQCIKEKCTCWCVQADKLIHVIMVEIRGGGVSPVVYKSSSVTTHVLYMDSLLFIVYLNVYCHNYFKWLMTIIKTIYNIYYCMLDTTNQYQFIWVSWVQVNHKFKWSRNNIFSIETDKTMKLNIQENVSFQQF